MAQMDPFGGGFPPGGGGQPMGLPPGGAPGGAPPGGGDPMTELSLGAMKGLGGGPGNALQKVDEALTLTHKLLMAVIPQVTNINPKVTKDLLQIAQRVMSVKVDLKKDMPISAPPQEMMGMPGQMMGSPPPGLTGMGGPGQM